MATHRRQFLQALAASGAASHGLVLAAAGQTPASAGSEPTRAPVREATGTREEILLTAADTPLGGALAEGLAAAYGLRLTAKMAVPGRSVLVSDLGADDTIRPLVRGAEGVVHVPGAYAPSDAAAAIERCTRSTYNLLQAAVQEGVKRLVYLSSLAVMTGYPEEYLIDEDWRPLARGDLPGLAEYLGEVVCREFAREVQIQVLVLRLGNVVQAREIAGQPSDPPCVVRADVVQAVSLALAAQRGQNGPRLGAWSVFHIVSGSPQSRYSSERAQRLLGYRPHVAGGAS